MKSALALPVALMAAVVALTGCAKTAPAEVGSGSQPAASSSERGVSELPASSNPTTPTPTSTPSAPAPTVEISAKSDIKAMRPDDTIKLAVTHGTVEKVTVTDAEGKAVEGKLDADVWKPTRNLLPASKYTMEITLTDEAGASSTVKRPFSTVKSIIATYNILYDGTSPGVGMPAVIQFDSAVETRAMRAEIEKHATVTTVPAQEGSWGWLDNRQLMWRPKNWFKPGTKVTINADIAGLQTGENKWVKRSAVGTMNIGDQRVLYTNAATHTMRVEVNGRTVRTIPITNGNAKYPTRSGTKVIIERVEEVVMDSETVKIPKDHPDAYKVKVKYAMRTTWTGEYVHAAPWSVASQGVANVSHGCTGMSTENARWLFNLMRSGDIDIVSGTNRVFRPTEGIGVWQYSWADWKAQSALG